MSSGPTGPPQPAMKHTRNEIPSSQSPQISRLCRFQVVARDDDQGANGQLSYVLSGGNEDGAFSLSSGGQLSLTQTVDREAGGKYVLLITAADSGTAHGPPPSWTVSRRILLSLVGFVELAFGGPRRFERPDMAGVEFWFEWDGFCNQEAQTGTSTYNLVIPFSVPGLFWCRAAPQTRAGMWVGVCGPVSPEVLAACPTEQHPPWL